MNDTPTPPASSSAHKPRRLGRGLASLMSNTREAPADMPGSSEAPHLAGVPGQYEPVRAESPPGQAGRPVEVALDAIRPNPNQPRRQFSQGEMDELSASIARQGVLQPLLVVRDGQAGTYTLIAGERRLRAARQAGLSTVPCVVRPAGAEQMVEWALVENIQRQDLNSADLARAYREYMDRFGATQQDLAEHIGQPRSTVANYLRLLDLSEPVLDLVAQGKLSFGHAKLLAGLAGQSERQEQLAREVLARELSVRALEQRLAAPAGAAAEADRPARRGAVKSQYILDVERQLSQAIGTKVQVRPGRAKNRGRIILEYYSLDDFDRIAEALGATIES